MATPNLPGAANTTAFHKYSSMQEIFTEDKEAFLSAEQKVCRVVTSSLALC